MTFRPIEFLFLEVRNLRPANRAIEGEGSLIEVVERLGRD